MTAIVWVADKVAGPAIVAVLFAGITSYLLERYRAKRDVLTKLSEQLRGDLNSIQTLIMDYYSRDYDLSKDPTIETQIIALDREITGALRIYAEYSKALFLKLSQDDSPDGSLDKSLDELSLAMMDVTCFQNKNRVRDADALRVALFAISNIRTLLTETKLAALRRLSGT